MSNQLVNKAELSITEISITELRQLSDRGGMVVLGAGGELQEWVDGITEELKKNGIVDSGKQPFKSAAKLKGNVAGENGRIDLVLFFNPEARVDFGKLAIWRIKVGDITWIEDFLVNYRNEYMENNNNQLVNKKVKLNLCGLDGNAFSLMGVFQRQARREKWTNEEIKKVIEECQSGDYDHLLVTLMDHCEVDDAEEINTNTPRKAKLRHRHFDGKHERRNVPNCPICEDRKREDKPPRKIIKP